MKLFHGSIRKKLIVLVLLATMPVFLVLLVTLLQNRNSAIKLAERDTALYLNGFAEIQRRITNSTQTLLRTVACIPEISSLNMERSRVVLETLLEANPIYTNVILVDLTGNVVAAGRNHDTAKKLNFGDRKQFKEAVASKGFASGEFVVGKSTQKAIFPFGMAVLNTQGEVTGAMIIGVNLDHYGKLFERGNYPNNTFFGICDHNGIRLFRYPSNDLTAIGQPVKEKVYDAVATSGTKGSIFAIDSGGKERVMVYEPLRLLENGETPYMYMFMGFDHEQLQEKANSILQRLVVTSLLSLAFSLFIAWFIGGRSVVRLIDRLSRVAMDFSQGDKNVTSNIDYSDGEIGGLAQSFDSMVKNIHQREEEKNNLETRLQQAQKMEAIGTLAGGIAHDFNNILTVILGYTEMAREDAPADSKYAKDLSNVLAAGNRAKDLVKQILAFSRQGQVDRMPLKIQPLIKEGLKMLRSSIPTTISITENIDPTSGSVFADPTQIHQILVNLCTNAYHAMETTGGELAVTLRTAFINADDQTMLLHLTPGEYVELTVTDTGSGIGPDIIERIFDPYFTTKEVGKGTGMGLAIIHGILKEYGGAITVDSQLGKGSTFHIYIPVIEKEALPEMEESKDIPMGNERILFIDDEELLAEMGKDMLERLGYHVTVRFSSAEALATFQNTPNEFDIVITDQTMPEMTGSDLARRMIQIRPDIPIILCTGYSNLIDEDSAKVLGVKEFALKPLTKGIISRLIRKILDKKA
nr:response regulator [Desulfobulbaceae bacterium]